MRKFCLFILLMYTAGMLIGCGIKTSGNDSDSKTAALHDSLSQLGINKEYYNETKALMDKYRSDEYKNSVATLYNKYGKKASDKARLKTEERKLESNMRSDYYGLFIRCTSDADRNMVLFGYNYSILCNLQYASASMGTGDKSDYTKIIDEYYNLFCELSSMNPFEDFYQYILSNGVFNYVTTISEKSIWDVAVIIKNDCVTFENSIATTIGAMQDEDAENSSTEYDQYCEAMDDLMTIISDLRQYSEYITQFTSRDLNELERLVNESKEVNKKYIDARADNDRVNIFLYGTEAIRILKEMAPYTQEIYFNATVLSE